MLWLIPVAIGAFSALYKVQRTEEEATRCNRQIDATFSQTMNDSMRELDKQYSQALMQIQQTYQQTNQLFDNNELNLTA
jgi:Rod binding domain-containing protein